MNETEFIEVVNKIFSCIEDAIDRSGLDVETVRNGHVLTLECESGNDIVINMHVPTEQIWMASRQGGLHFVHENGHWVSTRSKEVFWDALDRLVSQAIGEDVHLLYK